VRETAVKTGKIFASLWRQPAFYRFLAFMTLVVGVRMIFYHLFYTFPKFGLRELGDGAPIAQISSMVNSILIVVLVPITACSRRKSPRIAWSRWAVSSRRCRFFSSPCRRNGFVRWPTAGLAI